MHLRDKEWRRQQRAGRRVQIPAAEQRGGGAGGAGGDERCGEAGPVLLAPAGPLNLCRSDDDGAARGWSVGGASLQ
jgi:hypothetical protein